MGIPITVITTYTRDFDLQKPFNIGIQFSLFNVAIDMVINLKCIQESEQMILNVSITVFAIKCLSITVFLFRVDQLSHFI